MAKPSKAASTEFRIIDNIHGPDIFSDGVAGIFLHNGNIHLTLASRHCDYGSKVQNDFSWVVIGKLVLPFNVAEDLVRVLGDFINQMKSQTANTITDVPRTIQ